jgi:hypothetical protein
MLPSLVGAQSLRNAGELPLPQLERRVAVPVVPPNPSSACPRPRSSSPQWSSERSEETTEEYRIAPAARLPDIAPFHLVPSSRLMLYCTVLYCTGRRRRNGPIDAAIYTRPTSQDHPRPAHRKKPHTSTSPSLLLSTHYSPLTTVPRILPLTH